MYKPYSDYYKTQMSTDQPLVFCIILCSEVAQILFLLVAQWATKLLKLNQIKTKMSMNHATTYKQLELTLRHCQMKKQASDTNSQLQMCSTESGLEQWNEAGFFCLLFFLTDDSKNFVGHTVRMASDSQTQTHSM